MDLDTVGGLVKALVSTYDTGLEYYTNWQQRSSLQKLYRRKPEGKLSTCALSTSLGVSGLRIKEAWNKGAELLGEPFSIGDDQCCRLLAANLERLKTHIDILGCAAVNGGPLELFEVVRVSEAVRVSSLTALAKQYHRAAVSHLVPREKPARRHTEPTLEKPWQPTPVDDETQTTYHDASSSRSPHHSPPASPPPTPKMIPDDLQSMSTSGFGPRPKASVFSFFCPEAMKYQVNLTKTIPDRKKCKICGYAWRSKKTEDKAGMMVKYGFQLTPRFLGKSHCQGGFGCVLCTSSGKTETYEKLEDLRHHINAAHDKWQMLHDRDMAGR